MENTQPSESGIPITPLSEFLTDAHNGGVRSGGPIEEVLDFSLPEGLVDETAWEAELAEKYGVPVKSKKKNKQHFDPDVHEAQFAQLEQEGKILHGQRPRLIIQKESSEHIFLVYLFAQGHSIKEVYQQLGGQFDEKTNFPISGTGKFSYSYLQQLRKQSWFQTRLVQFVREQGESDFRAQLQTEVSNSLQTIVELRDDRKAPASVRLNAANSVLDRFFGKPTQAVEQKKEKTVADYEADMAGLQRQNEQMQEELLGLNASINIGITEDEE